MTSLIEEGPVLVLSEPKASRRVRVHLPVSKASDGALPGVDLNRSCELEEAMNEP